MTTLRERMQAELGNWRERLPAKWRPGFDGVTLDFNCVDPACLLAPDEPIWPQENSPNRSARLFKALDDLPPEKVRVVIFGNDPYTRIAQATGRSFEQGDLVNWARDIRTKGRVSPSMQTIVAAAAATAAANGRYELCNTRMLYDEPAAPKEPAADAPHAQPIWFAHVALALGLDDGVIKLPPPTRIFKYWADQGVLWLNRTLTYTKWDTNQRDSHRRFWEPFTNRMLELLVGQGADHPIVFALWGESAKQLDGVIRKLATRLKVKQTAVRTCKSGHPQWVAGYFQHGNPLVAVNKAIGRSGKPISWA